MNIEEALVKAYEAQILPGIEAYREPLHLPDEELTDGQRNFLPAHHRKKYVPLQIHQFGMIDADVGVHVRPSDYWTESKKRKQVMDQLYAKISLTPTLILEDGTRLELKSLGACKFCDKVQSIAILSVAYDWMKK
jgi:hypothetical protein